MGRLGSLVDVVLAARVSDARTLDDVAARWGLERLFAVTRSVAERVLLDDERARAPRILRRPLESLSERSLIESRFVELTAPFYGLDPARAATAVARSAASRLRPFEGEPWSHKLRRTGKIFLKSFSPVSEAERVRQSEHEKLVESE
jgi:hypothetical protein